MENSTHCYYVKHIAIVIYLWQNDYKRLGLYTTQIQKLRITHNKNTAELNTLWLDLQRTE